MTLIHYFHQLPHHFHTISRCICFFKLSLCGDMYAREETFSHGLPRKNVYDIFLRFCIGEYTEVKWYITKKIDVLVERRMRDR